MEPIACQYVYVLFVVLCLGCRLVGCRHVLLSKVITYNYAKSVHIIKQCGKLTPI